MNNLALVDVNMNNTPKQIVKLSGYGRIKTTNSEDKSVVFNTTDRIQPLCGKFGEHYPAKSVMEPHQITMAWDNTYQTVDCSMQTLKLKSVKSANSQLPVTQEEIKNLGADATSMPAKSYYSTTGDFHDNINKC